MSMNKRNFNEKFEPQYEEQNYQTLDELDLSDIAQAIDGGRSLSLKKAPVEKLMKKGSKEDLRTKRFWFW
jgi:hypothetical protein